MRNTTERVDLFKLLAKLLWYLISGRAHIGYLYNYNENPIHTIVSVGVIVSLILGTGKNRL